MTKLFTSSSRGLIRPNLRVFLLCALLLPSTTAASESREVVGRVVSVRGAVFAQAPGEERRILECRDSVYEGDRVLTLDDSDAGIDAGSYYLRLVENTVIDVGRQSTGQPKLDVVDGYIRLVDSAAGNGPPAELSTPGLRVARPGPDQEALVFLEKAAVVSIVCAFEDPVSVTRRTDPGNRMTATPGRCVVGKPREALYVAQASHPQIAVLISDACEELAMVSAGSRFLPGDVALGSAVLSGGAGGGMDGAPLPNGPPFGPGLTEPCSGSCGPGPAPQVYVPGTTSFPVIPPVLPSP